MVDIISRSRWGARAPRSVSRTTWSRRTEVTVHYSAGPTSQTPRQIQDFHMGSRGWSDIGYNFLVDSRGNAYEGRGWLVVGAHAAPRNTQGIGVCFIGRDGDVTTAAKNTIRALYDEANRRAGKTLAKKGHRDVNSTSCPGNQLYSWVRAGMPSEGSSTPPPDNGGSGKAPRFPLPSGYAFGPRNGPSWQVSGYYSHREDLRRWQRQMLARGWVGLGVADGLYGPKTEKVTRQFQAEKSLGIDGLIGILTWKAAWEAPIT